MSVVYKAIMKFTRIGKFQGLWTLSQITREMRTSPLIKNSALCMVQVYKTMPRKHTLWNEDTSGKLYMISSATCLYVGR